MSFATAAVIAFTYAGVLALVTGIVLGWRVRSPALAALAAGPVAVMILYGSIFALGAVFTDPKDYDTVDWGFLAALLINPAAPAFVFATVTACVASVVRAILRNRRSTGDN